MQKSVAYNEPVDIPGPLPNVCIFPEMCYHVRAIDPTYAPTTTHLLGASHTFTAYIDGNLQGTPICMREAARLRAQDIQVKIQCMARTEPRRVGMYLMGYALFRTRRGTTREFNYHTPSAYVRGLTDEEETELHLDNLPPIMREFMAAHEYIDDFTNCVLPDTPLYTFLDMCFRENNIPVATWVDYTDDDLRAFLRGMYDSIGVRLNGGVGVTITRFIASIQAMHSVLALPFTCSRQNMESVQLKPEADRYPCVYETADVFLTSLGALPAVDVHRLIEPTTYVDVDVEEAGLHRVFQYTAPRYRTNDGLFL